MTLRWLSPNVQLRAIPMALKIARDIGQGSMKMWVSSPTVWEIGHFAFKPVFPTMAVLRSAQRGPGTTRGEVGRGCEREDETLEPVGHMNEKERAVFK